MVNLLHFIDLPVAFHAADAAIDVNGVIEINVVRNPVNLHPWNRFAGGGALAHKGQPGIVLKNLVVAVHALAALRHVGIPGLLNIRMTIATVDPELFHVRGM